MPVVATKLTLALVDNKLREHRLNNVKEKVVSPGESYQAGCFKVEFIVADGARWRQRLQ